MSKRASLGPVAGANGCDYYCIPPCDVSLIQEIDLLMVVKTSPNDLRLSWHDDPEAGDGYNVWYMTQKSDIPACDGCPNCQPATACQPTGGVPREHYL